MRKARLAVALAVLSGIALAHGPVRFEPDGAAWVARGRDYWLSFTGSASELIALEGFGDVDNWFRQERTRLRFERAAQAAERRLEASPSGVLIPEFEPGIDLVCRLDGRTLHYSFVVSPEADASRIRVHLEGVGRMRIDPTGAVVIRTAALDIRLHPPVVRTSDARLAGAFAVERGTRLSFHPRPN